MRSTSPCLLCAMDGAYRGLISHVIFAVLEPILVIEFQFLCLGFGMLIIAKDQIVLLNIFYLVEGSLAYDLYILLNGTVIFC